MSQVFSWLWKALLFLGFVGYQFLVHSAFHETQGGLVRVTLLLLPMLVLACWVLIRGRNNAIWLAALMAAGVIIYLVEQKERLGLVAVYGIPHAAAYVTLLCFFGRTLMPGQEALITRLARRVHENDSDKLPPEMQTYTRQLTFIWCIFFAAQVVVSVILYRFASLDTWSLFVNLLNFPLLALLFMMDYGYRAIRFRHYPQASILKAIQVFIQDSKDAGPARAEIKREAVTVDPATSGAAVLHTAAESPEAR